MNRLKYALINSAVAALTIALMLCAIEGIVRLAHIEPPMPHNNQVMVIPTANAQLLFTYAPGGESMAADGQRYKLNSIGWWEREFSKNKAPGTYRIIAMGDSLTMGVNMPLGKNWTQVLESGLQQKMDHPVAVINAGQAAYNTVQELEYYKQYLTDWHGDLFVLQFFLNDVIDTPSVMPGGVFKYIPIGWKKKIEFHWYTYRFVRRRLDIVRQKYKRKQKLIDFADQGQNLWQVMLDKSFSGQGGEYQHYQDAMLEFHRLLGDRLVVLLFPIFDDLQHYAYEAYEKQIEQFLTANHIAYINVRPAVSNIPSVTLWAHPKDHHPNTLACDRIGRFLVPRLLPTIKIPAKK